MAKFHFRLATLRKLRETRRDEMQAKLAEAQQAQGMLQQQLAALQGEQDALLTARRQALEGSSSNVNQLLETQRYHAVLRAQESTMRGQIELLATEVQRRRQTLSDANREVRILDNLENRQRTTHRQKLERSETKELDEIASRRQEANDLWA
jgi:flagellar export protein FliJ